MSEFDTWLKGVKEAIAGEPMVDMSKHKPTDNELNNLVFLSCKYLSGWNMRDADFAVVKMMGGDPATVDDLDGQFIPALADYLWDHIMGEPTEPTAAQLAEAIKAIKEMLFRQDEWTRNVIEPIM